MECAQISVSGGTGATSPETYAIPGIYSVSRFPFVITIAANSIDQASDPGILFNVYNDQGEPYPTDYQIPG